MNKRYTNQAFYFRLPEDGGGAADDSHPFLINCTGVAALDKPFTTNRPKGRHDYYLMYMLQGELEGDTGGKNMQLKAGDLVLFPPEMGYAYQLKKPERMVYLWVHFTGSECAARLKELGLEMSRVYHPAEREELEQEIDAIHRLLIARPAFFFQECNARLEMLLCRVARYAHKTSQNVPPDRLWRSLYFLQRYYREKISMEQLAAMEYLSVSRYAVLFHQLTGRSPQQYLIELRLSNARQLLRETDLSVGDVAERVGYDDALYFSRLFKRYTGLSPRAFREK